MKMNRVLGLLASPLSAALLLTLASPARGAGNDTSAEFPLEVRFQLGEAEFFPGDSITIESVHGTSPTISTGQVYCVEGTYTLASKEEAELALYATTTSPVAVPTDAGQVTRIRKGTGKFRLVKTMRTEGYLHVSFYPVPSGSAFGGVYFGQGKWVLQKKGWSYLDQHTKSPDYTTSGDSTSARSSATGANRVLYAYLGEPVAPPADMNPAYTKEGLIKAIQTAARNAGVTIQQVQIDDSEYPFLVGLVCKEGDTVKLTDQLRKMAGYSYNGSTSTSTHSVFNIVPYRTYPSDVSRRIGHRTNLRCQVFLDKLLGVE